MKKTAIESVLAFLIVAVPVFVSGLVDDLTALNVWLLVSAGAFSGVLLSIYGRMHGAK